MTNRETMLNAGRQLAAIASGRALKKTPAAEAAPADPGEPAAPETAAAAEERIGK